MLPVGLGITPDQIRKRILEPVSFYNNLPDYGEIAGLKLPCLLGPDGTIPDLPESPEDALKFQLEFIQRARDKLCERMLMQCFLPGTEINNRDNLYSGKPGIAYLLMKNREYFLSNDAFMNTLVDKFHYRNLDDAIKAFYEGSIFWGQDRCEKSSLWTGSYGVRFVRQMHKWLYIERDMDEHTGKVQDEVDLNTLEDNVNWMQYQWGEGESFLSGRAGYLRSLLALRDASRYKNTKERLGSLINSTAEALVKSMQEYGRQNPLETVMASDSHPYVALPLRCQQLIDISNTMLIRKGDVGGSMGLMGIFYVLLKVVRESHKDSHKEPARKEGVILAPWQDLLHDSICCLETLENVWAGYPENIVDEWGGGIFTETSFHNGSTAAVWLYCLAYEVFQKESFLRAAERAAETCWRHCLTHVKIEASGNPTDAGADRLAGSLTMSLVQYNTEEALQDYYWTHPVNQLPLNSTYNCHPKGTGKERGKGGHEASTMTLGSSKSATTLGGTMKPRVKNNQNSTSVSGIGAYNNSSPIEPLVPRRTSRFNEMNGFFRQEMFDRTGNGPPPKLPKTLSGGNSDGFYQPNREPGAGPIVDDVGDDPFSDEEERKDFRLYGIKSDSKARHSGRQVKTKNFLLSTSGKGDGGGGCGLSGDRRASSLGAISKENEDDSMVVVLPDRYGVIRDPYYVAAQSSYSEARGWLSNNVLVASPKARRSIATRPFLINHGTGDKARIDNVQNTKTYDGGIAALRRKIHKQEKHEYDTKYRNVLDTRLFDGCVSNGYAMLRMAKTSRNPEKWEFRSKQLATAICDRVYEKVIPDLTSIDFHLGDGYAGLLTFLIDVLNPNSKEAGFPIFE